MELPELTQQPVLLVDGTPDEDYPLRILRAYRKQCDCRWADTTDGIATKSPLFKLMNEHAEQRAAILDRAIAILEAARKDLESRGGVLTLPFEELLVKAEAEGYVTGLVSDDAGHWAAVGDGIQPVPAADKVGVPWTTFDLSEARWADSPSEALILALYEAPNVI